MEKPDSVDSNTSRKPLLLVMGHLGRRLLRRFKYMLGYSPLTLPVYLRLSPLLLGISDTSKVGKGSRITSSTNLVVEGFPRSANTFCAEVFRYLASEQLKIVSHVHHVAQVKQAVRLGIPTIVMVREPAGCLSSYLVAAPHASVRGVLREYVAYHNGLRRVLRSCLVVDFEELTSDPDSVVERANAKFGFHLPPLSSVGSADEIFRIIESDHRSRYRGREETTLPRPDEARRELDWVYRERLTSPSNADLLTKAVEAYRNARDL